MNKEIKTKQITVKKTLSATKVILAVLRRVREGGVNTFLNHPYARALSGVQKKNTYQTALTRLKKEGLVVKKGRAIFRLSTVGEKAAMFAFIDGETRMFQRKIETWDGVWRIVFFDIPETKRHYRDYLRIILKAVGFKEFQRSVWVCPYQVPAFLKELLFEENIKKYTRFISAEKIDYDHDLRKLFGLKWGSV